jgi:methyl-accepting chemotaxis protein
VLGALEDVARDAAAMPALREEMQGLGEALGVLETMDGRMASIEAAMPVLVEVQQHLARVPDTLERLDANITLLSEALDRMLETLGTLAASVENLQLSLQPVSRIARRFPGRSARAHRNDASDN